MSRPGLTLPEELMLLALDPASGTPRVRHRHLRYGVAAAALGDLEALRFVAEDRGRVVPVSPPPTGEAALDGALGLFDDGRPVRARRWIRRRSAAVTEACARSLAARGLITVERRRALGLFPVPRYPLVSPDAGERVAAEFRGAAKTGFPEPRTRMLAALVSAIGLTGDVVPSGAGGRETRRTMRALARELWPAHVVRRLIRAEAADGGLKHPAGWGRGRSGRREQPALKRPARRAGGERAAGSSTPVSRARPALGPVLGRVPLLVPALFPVTFPD